jgi:hypothetical protein
MNDRLSLRDNRRSQIPSSEDASGIQAFRDSLALEYALSLSSSEADALAQDLSRLRDSKEGFSTVSPGTVFVNWCERFQNEGGF